jgi:hypothetical protein
MKEPRQLGFRLCFLAFAGILVIQSIWLVAPELIRPGIDRLPTDARTARYAADARGRAVLAAEIGIVRGDLWAESAFTYADLLWANRDPSPALTRELDQAHALLDKALTYAPLNTGAWLLLAGLASRFHWSHPQPIEALKMSYYTGPNEVSLSSLRLQIAMDTQAFSDPDMQQFVSRDLRLICCRQPELDPGLLEAYERASSLGKQFIRQTLGGVNPAYAVMLRAGAPTP